jgi:hypothetical protein
MSPRPRLPRTMWADDSIRVEVQSSSVTDEPENVRVFEACLAEMGSIRLRVALGCYGPGTEERPKPTYRWLLGESATILCRDLETCSWFREEFLKWLKSLDGVKLIPVDESDEGKGAR